jgi:hypothetical protein
LAKAESGKTNCRYWEQALFLFSDIVILLMERKGVSVEAMPKSHPNLEGLPDSFA